jgi:hypothetical protein
MDAHVPQRQSVVRLSVAALLQRWPAWSLAFAWTCLLAWMPWWAGLPLWLGLATIQVIQLPRLQRYADAFRRALRWGLAGLLVAAYHVFNAYHGLGLTLTALAALVGFSLLVLLESWQVRKPQRHATAAASPEWRELALAPIGPVDTLIELEAPHWVSLHGTAPDTAVDVQVADAWSCRVGSTHIEGIELQLAVSPGQRWLAWPMTARRGTVLYDRAHDKQYRLRNWQLYGWHADEAWLSRSEDQPPWALSHVLGLGQHDA